MDPPGGGPRFDGIELSIISSVVIAGNRREAAERLARERDWAGVQTCRERYGISYHVVSDRSMDAVAPIVARLAGA